ncbi:GtrA family protein [Serinicoccus kebangsaanensis]|uniref:GtrA family protein n=1 Tax=Serinicoccus kebangsaanensis TaxID=2602069 RepID=UPI00124C59B7|nr:GtrA family protein [Serinicoccus kebangsaanensis]
MTPSPSAGLLARARAAYQVLVAELAKFGTVGALAFVVDTALYNVLVFGVPGVLAGPMAESPLWGKVVATSVATVFSWVGNRLWTFRHRRSEPVAHEFGLFVVFNALGLLIALSCLGFSRYLLGLESQLADNIAGNGVGLVLGTLFRFWAYRRFVFRGELDLDRQGVVARGR